ncbi:hypothetical protein [Fibrobacter sp. UWEL]|uniref:hypothetical protein n=1 Tax=Fibrobacter sp. UWEL TaxID=1896209 RepID=UPI00091B9A55|nr:hypothetical protein [Fibrobacter sp. UWEL]SHK47054.1 hypothetical protein SAMN05720468_102157 [Fibrobacter sp. UWEL]
MKFSVLVISAVAATLLAGCSGIKTPKAQLASHDMDHNIPAIDDLIVTMKQDYINKCYMPVAKRRPPENQCQSELFQMLERNYRLEYQQVHVDRAANELFFKDVAREITILSKKDPDVRNAIRNGGFRSNDEMLAYYKDAYKFETK